ncbi:MAG: hypothetical protein QOG10_7138, partial [Kribbellaceae bacterium]|nr:hypothetical protein [Kribbellaceae bacterium]
MFEGVLSELDTRTLLSAGAEFRAVEDRAAVRQLEVALAFADRYPDPRGEAGAGYGSGYDEALPGGGERGRVYGGVGCPAVAEFAVAEFAAVFGWSTGAGAAFIGEALALRHRFPRIWAKVLAGEAVPWRARQVARMCLALSVDAAAIVDKRVVGVINSVGLDRLRKIVKAAIFEADPEGAKKAAEAAARKRGVFVGESDEYGTKTIWVMATAGDVIRFDATIDDLARALRTLGDPDSLDLRRAKAIGWIADPASAHRLLEAARLIAATRRDGADHTSSHGVRTDGAGGEGASGERTNTDSAGAEGATAEGTSTDGAGAESATGESATGEGAGADAGGAAGQGASADGADTTGTNRGGKDSAGDRAGRAAADTPADAHTSTDSTAPCSTQSRPADHAATADTDTDSHADGDGDSDSGEGRAGDEAERARHLAADPPTDLAADVAADVAADWPEGWVPAEEPGPDDEADRDTPHPSNSDHLDHLDALDTADLLDIMA